jgi:DNA-binding NtrC family response regulator
VVVRGNACVIVPLLANSDTGEEKYLMIYQRRSGNGRLSLEFPAGMGVKFRGDMEQLIEVFLARLNKFSPRNIRAVHPEVLEAFKKYHWPGNIRELQNLIERAYIIEKSPVLTKESFPGELFDASVSHSPVAPLDITLTLAEVRRNALDDIERSYLKQLLTAHCGRIKDTARRAGVSNRQLFTLMKRLGLRKEEFK